MSWTDASSLATGAGTLVLAVATFASVRSANRAARVAEQALLVNMRPLLVASRMDDTRQKIFFQEGRYMLLEGGRGGADFENGVVYLGISLRNAGPGIAVLHGWRFLTGVEINPPRPELETFRHQGRDLLIAPGDIGFWQGAFRDSGDPQYDEAVTAVKADDDEVVLGIDLLYGDNDGGQRVISRMMLRGYTREQEGDRHWIASVVRHWNVDRPDPR
ncbi:MAG TPA: hypothetical protein VNW50_17930 [Streptosporangiaceae bacterium]|nr:hypothetical protein [Streptosporangiaceae bacterium]